MNILFYCSEYPPFRNGGIGSVTKIVAESLVKLGHRVVVAGYYPSMPKQEIVENINGVCVYRYGLGVRNSWFKNKMWQISNKLHFSKIINQREINFIEGKISELIELNNIDLLELTDYYTMVYCKNTLRFRKFNIPTILRIHGSVSFINDMAGNPFDILHKNDCAHFNRCDHVLAVSEFSLNYIREKFILPNIKSYGVIYNPIEDSIIHKATPSDKDTVLFLGRLTKEKGAISLVKAFNLCAGKNTRIRLQFLGAGDAKTLLEHVDSQYHDRIEFLGHCNRQKVVESIDQCSFACIPSYFENFSMAALEVMSRNKTIIFTERASGKELINDGVNGFAVDPDNISLISERMLYLANNRSMRDEMANNAYNDIVEKFPISKIVEQLEQYYHKIISEHR